MTDQMMRDMRFGDPEPDRPSLFATDEIELSDLDIYTGADENEAWLAKITGADNALRTAFESGSGVKVWFIGIPMQIPNGSQRGSIQWWAPF